MHPLDGCRAKIRRARAHLEELKTLIQFGIPQPPVVITWELHHDTQEAVLMARANAQYSPPPVELTLISGEIAHQLCSALDHLVWQLVVVNTGQPPAGTKSGFPIFNTEAGYNKWAPKMIAGVSDAARDQIRVVQPYHAGPMPKRHPPGPCRN